MSGIILKRVSNKNKIGTNSETSCENHIQQKEPSQKGTKIKNTENRKKLLVAKKKRNQMAKWGTYRLKRKVPFSPHLMMMRKPQTKMARFQRGLKNEVEVAKLALNVIYQIVPNGGSVTVPIVPVPIYFF